MSPVRTLLVDNYDSFTHNVVQLLAEVNGVPPVVLRNDDLDAWAEFDPREWDNLVISPGPGSPGVVRDFGLSRWFLEHAGLPVLGICLGHQGLCMLAGARVRPAPEPVHGRLSRVRHDGSSLFDGVPSPFQAVRYHSLVVDRLPPELTATAWTDDGLVMAVEHRERPWWGVQFHPESILSEHGHRLLSNFRDLTPRRARTPRRPAAPPAAVSPPEERFRVEVRRLPFLPDAEHAYETLFSGGAGSFWLDSSAVVPGRSRFSFLGDAAGPHGEEVEYDLRRGDVVVRRAGQVVDRRHETLFDHLERELDRRRVADPGLAHDFSLGYVGYLGYEVKADSGGEHRHASPFPDGRFVFCDRALALDHVEGTANLLALSTPDTRAEVLEWLDAAARRLVPAGDARPPLPPAPPATDRRHWTARHSPERYREMIAECRREITRGESYEICLTTMLSRPVRIDPWQAYRVLRAVNPAPYSAFLRFPDFAVLSSSPERFLRIDRDRVAESKPIKGTRRRDRDRAVDAALAEDLRTAEKDRSENLMIVDLVRNDLGRVAKPGGVRVTKLFDVESYPTVHQLVTTVQADLADGVSAVAAVRAAYPGGSMTGAPKARTMEIIDRLEGGWRGVYSGALGFFSLNGCADFNIVIRTAVVTPDQVHVGVGGAIVALSDAEAELREVELKAEALLRVVAAVDAARPVEVSR
ncbi:aminodeoxychorismate synthase component I [Saccharothrix variisporea]|uniref:aminodeoxychorismate synthase n=1 Tax=Saccharothrix variisporea TaxID=543527 RepID=A0A495XNE8_9PSEU|nr:aminodeoxychorismate synthase component I [Saccharothrix variisporea]RKT74426.1 para-aminobenzoate synthetase [Saccharothrix variisporea]